MTDDAFSAGMAVLARAFGVKPEREMVSLWWDAVGHLTDRAWDGAVMRTVQITESTYGKFPPPGLVLKHVEPELAGEAVAAYERVIAAGVYGAESGTVWTYQRVHDTCGRAAADAFLEAGAHEAFRSEFGSDRRRERFLAAYQREARERPAARLKAGDPEAKLLPAGDAEPMTRPQATSALEAIANVARITGDVLPSRPKVEPMSDEEWERRKAALEQQARELTGEGAA